MNIGHASMASGVSAKMIRYYESVGLIRAADRKDSNYRDFNDRDVGELTFIRRARNLGFSVEEITRLLGLWRDRSRSSREVKAIAQQHIADLEARVAEMQAMADALRQLSHACAGDDRPDCPILGGIGGINLPGSEPSRRTG